MIGHRLFYENYQFKIYVHAIIDNKMIRYEQNKLVLSNPRKWNYLILTRGSQSSELNKIPKTIYRLVVQSDCNKALKLKKGEDAINLFLNISCLLIN